MIKVIFVSIKLGQINLVLAFWTLFKMLVHNLCICIYYKSRNTKNNDLSINIKFE